MTEQEQVARYNAFNARVHAQVMKFLEADQEKFVRIELHPIYETAGRTGLARMIELEAVHHFYFWEEDY